MAAPIIVQPADSLVDAITVAAQTAAPVLLAPGAHLTKGGHLKTIAVGAGGLKIRPLEAAPSDSASAPMIKRPDFSIPETTPDGNYGLYFEPAPPSPEEEAAFEWRVHTGSGDPFEFAVLIRGFVEISGLQIDCNMGLQNLDGRDDQAVEHNAMLGFSGKRYKSQTVATSTLERRVYVGFKRVVLRDLCLLNGDFADDIWFSRGYFHPNIERVDIRSIKSPHGSARKRATISFSGLSQKISVRDCEIHEIHLEDTTKDNWREQPRRDLEFKPSQWRLQDITMDDLSLAAKGHAFTLDAKRLEVTRMFYAYQAAGTIRNSSLSLPNNSEDCRMIRHGGLKFDHVEWRYTPTADGKLRGIKLVAGSDEPCRVQFVKNKFTVGGDIPAGGEFIDSQHTSGELNRVEMALTNCVFPVAVTTSPGPDLKIARVEERGTWKFTKDSFGALTTDQALAIRSGSDIQESAKVVKIEVP
jgi:hypothetical protein